MTFIALKAVTKPPLRFPGGWPLPGSYRRVPVCQAVRNILELLGAKIGGGWMANPQIALRKGWLITLMLV